LKRVGGFYFVSNTGSNTLSSLRIDDGGQPALANAVAANTHPGPDRSSFERPFPLRPDWAHEHGGRVPRRLWRHTRPDRHRLGTAAQDRGIAAK